MSGQAHQGHNSVLYELLRVGNDVSARTRPAAVDRTIRWNKWGGRHDRRIILRFSRLNNFDVSLSGHRLLV